MGSQEKSSSIFVMFSILQECFIFADPKVIAKVCIALQECNGLAMMVLRHGATNISITAIMVTQIMRIMIMISI